MSVPLQVIGVLDGISREHIAALTQRSLDLIQGGLEGIFMKRSTGLIGTFCRRKTFSQIFFLIFNISIFR